MASQTTIADQIRTRIQEFTATERKAAHVLLATYPLAGLEPVADFASRAGVSAPTVLRFIARLGIGSYPDFQRRLRDELEAQLKSPLAKVTHDGDGGPKGGDALARFKAAVVENLEQTFAHVPPAEFEAVVDLLADTKRGIYLAGGRFTDPVARYVAAHLRIVRPRVTHMAGQAENLRDQILDMGRHDVLFVFDIRRYQEDTVALAKSAAGRGVKIVLVTDQWLSPISRVAAHVLSAHVSAPSNWDSSAAMIALLEAVLAAVTERLWPSAKARIAEIEALRSPE